MGGYCLGGVSYLFGECCFLLAGGKSPFEGGFLFGLINCGFDG